MKLDDHREATFYADMNEYYDVHMRMTISLEDRLGQRIRQRAAREGLSVSAFVRRVLDDALKQTEPPQTRPFRLIVVGEGGVLPGVDLDRPGELLVAEDQRRYRPSDER